MMNNNKSKIAFSLSMIIFGTIGIFRRFIPLPSGFVAMIRGFIGAAFLALIMLIFKKRPNFSGLKRNLLKLLVSGVFIGFNWILLFESYNKTSVATATLCYYTAPVFVMLLSPFVFKEKIRLKGILCIISAAIGMVFVSGVDKNLLSNRSDKWGILLGLGAALLYSFIIIISKTITGISPYEKTFTQLFIAGVVILPYTLLAESVKALAFSPVCIVLLLTVGILHTGIAYAVYFGSMEKISAKTVAVLSYIDPVVAVILSAVILRERMTLAGIIGAVLIIGAAVVSEFPEKG